MLPLVALFAGYLLTWFLFGLPALLLVPLLFAGACIFAFYVRGSVGLSSFVLIFLLILILIPLLISLWIALNFDAYIGPNAGSDTSAITGAYVYGTLILSLTLFVVLVSLIWFRHWSLQTPLAPWLFLAGVATLAYWPPIPLDGRAIQRDSFLSPVGEIYGQNSWTNQLSTVPDQQELPPDFEPDGFVAMTRCSATHTGRFRFLSFRASDPLLLVVLENRQDFYLTSYAAVFEPGTHRKLTRWHALPMPRGRMRSYHPYLLARGYYELPQLPREFEAELRRK